VVTQGFFYLKNRTDLTLYLMCITSDPFIYIYAHLFCLASYNSIIGPPLL
jgi:hypothetical protein